MHAAPISPRVLMAITATSPVFILRVRLHHVPQQFHASVLGRRSARHEVDNRKAGAVIGHQVAVARGGRRAHVVVSINSAAYER